MQAPLVIKVSGHELDEPAFLAAFAGVVHDLNVPVVVVHGGGKEISALQQTMGIEPRYVDGLRITDSASLVVVEMVLCGTVNKRLVRHLLAAGVNALGISGVDLGLVRARKLAHPVVDMGYTGAVASVRGDLLLDFLGRQITPVLAPICLGEANSYNVNADHVAGAVAAAIGAERLVFLSNVEGVLVNEQVVPTLSPAQTEALIEAGAIFGGMIPKVWTALDALERGVAHAVITNLDGLKAGGGTIFSAE